jgi:hypothetical protein
LVPGVIALYEKSWGHEKDGITRLIKASQSKSNQERNEMGVGGDSGGERGSAAEAAAAQRRRYGIVDGQVRKKEMKAHSRYTPLLCTTATYTANNTTTSM